MIDPVVRIYFDHNATTPLHPAVLDAVTHALADDFGNASSVHAFGQTAKAHLDLARARVAQLIGAEAGDLVFTAGGTEADNFAVRGVAEALESRGRSHLVASAIEHEAVLNTCKHLARRGWTVSFVPPTSDGLITPEALRAALTPQTALVSVMHANNEIGTVQPIAELVAAAHEAGALFHTDAVQTVGKLAVDVTDLGVDLLSLSGHKFGGPKGAGALWIRRGTRLAPILTGGRHERNRRAGTENVPALVGLGVAAVEATGALAAHAREVGALRDRLEEGILARVPQTVVNGAAVAARAQHDEHQLRARRGRVAPHRTRSRGHRRLHRVGVLLRHAGAVARAEGDAPAAWPHAGRAALQPRRHEHAGGSRSRARRAAGPGREAAIAHADAGRTLTMRIVVAMSGGVDSSVAAARLAEAGHEVVGLSMQLYDQRDGMPHSFGRCCTLDDLHDARRVAAAIGIPHYVLNLERQFQETVVANFVQEYASGRTPIPCSHCNSDLKFATLVDRAAGFGAEVVATGHYARVDRAADGRYRLYRGRDPQKDQSYISLRPDTGAVVARRVSGRRDGEGRRARLCAPTRPSRRRQARQPGNLLRARRRLREVRGGAPAGRGSRRAHHDAAGEVLGHHEGVHRYTVGQRKGLRLSSSDPLYVLEIRPDTRTLVVGDREALDQGTCEVADVNWIAGQPPGSAIRAGFRSAIATRRPRRRCSRTTAARRSPSTSRSARSHPARRPSSTMAMK